MQIKLLILHSLNKKQELLISIDNDFYLTNSNFSISCLGCDIRDELTGKCSFRRICSSSLCTYINSKYKNNIGEFSLVGNSFKKLNLFKISKKN